MTKRITDKAIRKYLGHNGSECRVVIRRNGDVHRIGSPDASNRSADFWAYMGRRDDVAHQMTLEERQSNDAHGLRPRTQRRNDNELSRHPRP